MSPRPNESPADYAAAWHPAPRSLTQRAVDAFKDATRQWHPAEVAMLALSAALLILVAIVWE